MAQVTAFWGGCGQIWVPVTASVAGWVVWEGSFRAVDCVVCTLQRRHDPQDGYRRQLQSGALNFRCSEVIRP